MLLVYVIELFVGKLGWFKGIIIIIRLLGY